MTALADLIRSALLLQEGTAAAAELRQALVIVFLAGLSSALGQSVVLLAGRVAPRRFLLSLLLQAGLFLGGYLLWSLTIWLGSHYLFGVTHEFRLILIAIGVAYSPFLLSFFVLAPYVGSFFSLLLSVWTLLAIVLSSRNVLGLTLLQTVVAGGLGWVLLHLLSRLVGGLLLQLATFVRRRTAGTPAPAGKTGSARGGS
jgi:hypothetical protein